MEVLEANFTATSLVIKGELATDPVNGNASHQLYFVKPLEDSDPRARIEEAESLIESLNERRIEIVEKLNEKKLEKVISRLDGLYERDRTLKNRTLWEKKCMEPLQQALDKLSLKNNAYQDRAINSSLVADDINCRNFNFKLLHGSKNLVAERNLLREIKASEKGEIVSLWSSLKEMDSSILPLKYNMFCRSYDASTVRDKQILKEIKQLEIAKEKAIANASVKGKIWNSLGTKETFARGNQNNGLEDLKKEHLLLRADIKKVKKKLPAVEKDAISLQKQLVHLRRRKDKAYQHIVLLKEEQNKNLD